MKILHYVASKLKLISEDKKFLSEMTRSEIEIIQSMKEIHTLENFVRPINKYKLEQLKEVLYSKN